MKRQIRLLTLMVAACAAIGVIAAPSSALADSCVAPYCPAPTVKTKAANHITQTAATLHGTVNPNGSTTSYHFQYGRTTGYGRHTASKSAGNGTAAVDASTRVTDLKKCTTYHFRIVATNTGGTSRGGDKKFTTDCPPNHSSVEIIGNTGKLNRAKTKATVKVACRGGDTRCKGTLTLSRKGKRYGSAHFNISKHSVDKVTVDLNNRGQNAVSGRRKLKVRATAVSTNHTGRDSEKIVLHR